MEVHTFVVLFCLIFFVAKYHSYSQYKLVVSYTIVLYISISFFLYYGGLPMATGAILATIANGGRAIVDIIR